MPTNKEGVTKWISRAVTKMQSPSGRGATIIRCAAAQGDRSENAEYTYGKRRLRKFETAACASCASASGNGDRRRLHRRTRAGCSRAWVSLEAATGTAAAPHRGPDELDLAPGYISMDSPLGRALLAKRSTMR